MGHEIDIKQYGRGYDLDNILKAADPGSGQSLREQVKALDRKILIIAISVIITLSISGIAFIGGAVLSGVLIGASFLASAGLLNYLHGCWSKRASVVQELDHYQECHKLFSGFLETIDPQITKITLDEGKTGTLAVTKDQIDMDLPRGIHVYYNGERFHSADALATACGNNLPLLQELHQGISASAQLLLQRHLWDYSNELIPQQFRVGKDETTKPCLVKVEVEDTESVTTVMAMNYFHVVHTSKDALVNGLSFQMSTVVDLKEMTRKTYGSRFLGSSGMSAIPTK